MRSLVTPAIAMRFCRLRSPLTIWIARRGTRSASAKDAIVALAQFLLADELERVAQRRDARLDRRLDVPALQLEAVDFALDVLQAGLRFLEEQIRSTLGFTQEALAVRFRGADDAFRLG